ncbi:MAG: aminoacyl-tRNA hydrolase [Endomicrobium sp.]|jgi:PTH1 family peptidyl-tRNA hydrolase|nr:aminoacyl-tRNA hydrolase [Endomicrobium sp.]
MSRQIKLFIGLGNPEKKLENTRHNLGFIILDEIAKSENLSFNSNKIINTSFAFLNSFNNDRIWLLKPMISMNLSGGVIAFFMKYYGIDPDEIFIFYDDFSIQFGECRIRTSGSSGGHNGIRSVIEHLHTNNFPRMKLGTGPENLTAALVAAQFKRDHSIRRQGEDLVAALVAAVMTSAQFKRDHSIRRQGEDLVAALVAAAMLPYASFVLSEFNNKNNKENEKINLIKRTSINVFKTINMFGIDKAIYMLANKKL